MAGLGKVNKWNPYSGLINKNYLFNTATGKADHEETTIFLLVLMEAGRKAQSQFIESSFKDSSGFSRLIKRQKIQNFATQTGRFKLPSALNKKLVAVTMTRDLFGNILFLALLPEVNMGEVLWYPLTTVPLSLCHPGEIMMRWHKFLTVLRD